MGDPRSSTPEEWIIFAKTRLQATGNVVDVVQGLADSKPDLLEFLMSADEAVRGAVRDSLCGPDFPATHNWWLSSIGCALFQRFLTYFNRIPLDLNLVDPIIDKACRQAIPYLIIASTLGQIQLEIVEHEEGFATKKGKKHKISSAMDSHQNTSTINPQLFTTLGLEYPTTSQELEDVEAQVLEWLRVLLEVLLDAFENPEVGRYSETLAFGDTSERISEQTSSPTTMDPSTGEWMLSIPLSCVEVDWKRTGEKLFNKGSYSQAAFCFRKADLPLESDMAAAYESRKQARLLQVAHSVDQATCSAAFIKAAEEFHGCALSTDGKEQTSCYLRAAECYQQAEEWTDAAKAYYSANNFNMAVRNFRRAGDIDEAVEVAKAHGDNIQESILEDIIAVARLEYFRTGQLDKASELFDGVEEQLEYMEDYGITGNLTDILEYHKRYDEAAEIAFAEDDIVEGVRLLLRSDNPTSVRRAVEQALGGLWKMLPFGLIGDQLRNPAIPLLIDQLCGITVLNDDESHELETFQALNASDTDKLITLAQTSVDSEFQSPSHRALTLLCFSHISPLLIPGQNSTIPEFIKKAHAILDYIDQLLQFSQSLDVSSLHTQRLLGFEPVEKGQKGSRSPEFCIFSTSPMFEGARKLRGDIAPSSFAFGLLSLVVSESDTRDLALRVIHDTVQSLMRKMHNAANSGWYLYPCLEFAVFGECIRSECGKQEIDIRHAGDEQRQELFNAVTRALILQIQIVHQVHNYPSNIEYRDFKRTWARKFYENFMPHFPPLGSAVCVDPRQIPEFAHGIDAIVAWCEDALNQIDPKFGSPNKFISDVLTYLDTSYRLDRQSYFSKLHSRRLVGPRDDLMIEGADPAPTEYSIVHCFINFYTRDSPDAISQAVRAVRHIAFTPLTIEANVFVNLLDFIGREIIIQCRWHRKGNDDVFDQLLIPRSWALDLAKHPPLPLQRGILLGVFLDTLFKTLELLRSHNATSSPLYVLNGRPSSLVRSLLAMRICRLLVLFASNTSMPFLGREDIRQQIAQSLAGPSDLHPSLCANLQKNETWNDLWNAVRYSALNSGADKLVHLSRRRGSSKAPTIGGVKSIVYSNINPELEQLLSFVGSEVRLNPSAKPLVPQASSPAPRPRENTSPPTKTYPGNQLNIGEPPDFLTSENNFSPTLGVGHQHTLTSLEISTGKKILFCFRRYRCYLRHRLRHRSPVTTVEGQIRTLHREYEYDLRSIYHPCSNTPGFRSHKRILLGCMPHVWVYLLGAEHISQQQKEASKKKLQQVRLQELDNLRLRMDACVTLTRKIKVLKGRIAPRSPVLRQIGALREEVKQVDSLRSEIINTFGEDSVPESLEEHYALGILAILSPPYTSDHRNPQR